MTISTFRILILTVSTSFLFCSCLLGQGEYNEEMEDPYLPMVEAEKRVAEPYDFTNPDIFTIQVNNEGGNDILLDAANEPSLAVNPLNSEEMVIGWRQFDNIESNFRQAGIAYTTNGGVEWTVLPPIEEGIFRSDPVLATNSDGTFFYSSLAVEPTFFCDFFKSDDLINWGDKTYAFGGDKQWVAIDKTENETNGNVYQLWNGNYSECSNQNFTRSTDGGETFESCYYLPQSLLRGSMTVGVDGDVYVCGVVNNSFIFGKSSSASDADQEVVWDIGTEVDLAGSLPYRDGPNPAGMLAQVWVDSDHSDGPTRGNVYMLSSVVTSSAFTGCDVMFARSTDGGATWEEPLRLDDDNDDDNYQWFGTMSVAPNGRIDVVWLDTRDNPDTFLSSLYYIQSNDGGDTWSENIRLSESFDPHLGWPNQNKMGDYFHMISSDDGAHLAWAATFTGGQDVYYSYIPAEIIVSSTDELSEAVDIVLDIHPNPVNDEMRVHIQSNVKEKVSLMISDPLGRAVHVKDMEVYPGQNYTVISVGHLKKGLYHLVVQTEEGRTEVKRFLKV